jgi:type IV pilus assembly protein PilB
MASEDYGGYPSHLRPVPGLEATAPALEEPESATPGLTSPTTRGRSGRFITDVLVELGYLAPDRMESAVSEARTAGRPPEQLLIEQGAITSDQLSRAVAERYGLYHVDLNEFHVDMAAATLLPVPSARRYNAVPIGYEDSKTLLVAMADPSDVLAADDIQMATGLACKVAVAAAEDVEALIGRLNSLQSAVTEAVEDSEDPDADGEGEGPLGSLDSLHASAEDAPVVKLVYSVLGQAVSEGASDIHFEPEEEDMRVRFRIDGVLHEAAHVPKRMVNAVISRVKIMSELNIAEKRMPQDGRVSVSVDDRPVDLRVTTLPTQRGEGATIRILDKDNAMRSLDELGVEGEARKRLEASIQKPYGAVLVTGPTGSGKSTTLYAALQMLNGAERKVITVEDPVEYKLDGINQINVNPKAGLTFATGLRSILRADPDIIMVGEVRDGETARIAIEAALTGHMVLTTLHTNDAPGAIARLSKMGIESFLTASAVDCVAAQRLARKLCPHCKQRTMLSPATLAEAGFKVPGDLEAYEPVGCARCSSGYRGRVGLYSVMVMSERIKDLTVGGSSEAEISAAAREEGMLTLREDGFTKVRAGLTSLSEIVRVTT